MERLRERVSRGGHPLDIWSLIEHKVTHAGVIAVGVFSFMMPLKMPQVQGARLLRREAYSGYVELTKETKQRRRAADGVFHLLMMPLKMPQVQGARLLRREAYSGYVELTKEAK
jgi:hypothetical protein